MNSDLTLARVLLSGFIKDHKQRYLKGADEREPRRALARLLRSDAPLHRDVRDALAALIDPDNKMRITDETGECPALDVYTNARKLTFQFRSKKRRPDHVRNTAIAQHMHDGVASGLSVEEAAAATAERFGLKDRAVMSIWGGFRWARERQLFG